VTRPQQQQTKQVMTSMGVRIVEERHSNVIPLHSQDDAAGLQATPLTESVRIDTSLPEPTRLYGLVVLAFLLHTPSRFIRRCVRCGTAWPCDQLRLAFRIREGL
jgi:hypothetical protein